MMAATAMSKLIDSLTGYFFSGSGYSSGSSGGGTTTVDAEENDAPPRPHAHSHAPGHARGVGPDPILNRAERTEHAAVRSGVYPGVAGRLRDRILRRPTQRGMGHPDHGSGSLSHFNTGGPSSTDIKPWGDDVVASPRIHPLAVIDPRAELAADVEVGPFCVIGPHVSIGPGCRLLNHVTILGHTTIGSDNTFHPHCVIGNDPQDKKFNGEPTRLVIGDGKDIREHVTIHTGTITGGGVTSVGDRNLLMIGAHIGHDAVVGHGCVLGNNIMLAGHVHVGNRVSMMAGSAVHHFVTIGDYAFVGGYSQIHVDVPPYVKVDGEDRIRAVNVIGMRRSGEIAEDDIAALEIAARRLFINKKQPMSVKMKEMLADPALNGRVREVIDTIRRRALGKHGRYLEGQRKA